jgi:hypothetical protein
MKLNPTIETAGTADDGTQIPATLTHCSSSPIKWGSVRLDGGVNPLDAYGKDNKTNVRFNVETLP